MSEASLDVTSPDAVEIRQIVAWGRHEIEAFETMMARRTKDSPWKGRWDLNERYFQWKFAGNPQGKALFFGAFVGEAMLGSFSLCPLGFEENGRHLKGGELGDIYVDEALRGQGIFRRLVEAMTKAALAAGFDFVFCVPNKAGYNALMATGAFLAAPRAQRKLCVLPLSLQHFGPGALKLADPPWRGIIGLLAGKPGQVQRVQWQSLRPVAEEGGVRAVLDTAYRIGAYPASAQYRMSRLNAAWAIAKETEHNGRNFLMVGRIESPHPAAKRALLRALIIESLAAGRDAIALWAHVDDLATIIRPGTPFIPVGTKNYALLKTPVADAIVASGVRIEIDMIHTDKI